MEQKKMRHSVCMLNWSQLHPHPDNPRKDLGDLSELRDSIKAHGIMQNLTVIPIDDSYENFRILIGHRRHAAAEGILDKLPCVIVEGLSDREQVGIMLCENLQRNDLTYYEQGKGFQMMMDLGDTVDQIKEKTGFSEKTIKHRIEIAKLSKKAIEMDRKWQLSLGDLMALEKIKDVKQREAILKQAYSSENLYSRIDRYIKEETAKENLKKAKKILKDLGIKENTKKNDHLYWKSAYEVVLKFDLETKASVTLDDFKKLSDRMKVDYIWEFNYGTLYVVKKVKKTKEKNQKQKSAAEIKAEQFSSLKKRMNMEHDSMCKLYLKFIIDSMPKLNCCNHPTEDDIETAWQLVVSTEANTYFEDIPDIGGDELTSDYYRETSPMLGMLTAAATAMANSNIVSYMGEPLNDMIECHKVFLKFLAQFGFFIPDEVDEKVCDGTSDLWAKLENLKP